MYKEAKLFFLGFRRASGTNTIYKISTGSYYLAQGIQYLVINYNGTESEKIKNKKSIWNTSSLGQDSHPHFLVTFLENIRPIPAPAGRG